MLRLVIECDSPGCTSPFWSTEGFAPGQGFEKMQSLQKDLASSGWTIHPTGHLCPDHAPQPHSEDR